MKNIMTKDQVSQTVEASNERMDKAGNCFDALLFNECTVEDVTSDENLQLIKREFTEKTKTLKMHTPAKLWIQYMQTVDILRKFIKSE